MPGWTPAPHVRLGMSSSMQADQQLTSALARAAHTEPATPDNPASTMLCPGPVTPMYCIYHKFSIYQARKIVLKPCAAVGKETARHNSEN